jgi:hypothetical protein
MIEILEDLGISSSVAQMRFQELNSPTRWMARHQYPSDIKTTYISAAHNV